MTATTPQAMTSFLGGSVLAGHPEGLPWKPKHAEAATGISETTLARMADAGSLPCIRVGRRRLYPDAAIRQLIQGGVASYATR